MINSFALALLLGSELSYYLLILQTGIVEHYDCNLLVLSPMFIGGVVGTLLAGISWGRVKNPLHKIYIALILQLILSFSYPDYTLVSLFLLGLSAGVVAPLSIYLFKAKEQSNFYVSLAIAYTVGTYFFASENELRAYLAIFFTLVALLSSLVLKNYKLILKDNLPSYSFTYYLPLMIWIFLDSNLFETLSRKEGMDIWFSYTYTIIIFHLLGLFVAYFSKFKINIQHLIIGLLFIGSYSVSYLEMPLILAIIYPFTISYYNVIVFSSLSKENNLQKLSYMMVFVGWIASGMGLWLALSHLLP